MRVMQTCSFFHFITSILFLSLSYCRDVFVLQGLYVEWPSQSFLVGWRSLRLTNHTQLVTSAHQPWLTTSGCVLIFLRDADHMRSDAELKSLVWMRKGCYGNSSAVTFELGLQLHFLCSAQLPADLSNNSTDIISCNPAFTRNSVDHSTDVTPEWNLSSSRPGVHNLQPSIKCLCLCLLRILSKKTVKHTCGSRLGSVLCRSRTKTTQKYKTILN